MEDNKILIKNVSLIDGVKKEATPAVSILIEGKKIKRIGKEITASQPARVIEGERKTAMPGMMDCHVHLSIGGVPNLASSLIHEPFSMRALRVIAQIDRYLPAGFTTIADLGSPGYVGVSLRNLINQGVIKGPRVFAAGKLLSITGGHGQFVPPWVSIEESLGEIVDGCDRVREAVRKQLANGVDIVKFCATGGVADPVSSPDVQEFSDEEMEVIIKEANRVRKRTAAHAQGLTGTKAAIRAGVSSIEHGWVLDDECIELMKKKGTFLVPTLSVSYWIAEKGIDGGIPEAYVKKQLALMDKQKESFAKVLGAGVKIALGTDAGGPFNMHGNNAFELELMVRNGMSEMEAIIAATKTASENLRISDEVGTIEEGKLADMIIVEGNPLNDISLLQKEENIKTVIKDGAIVAEKT